MSEVNVTVAKVTNDGRLRNGMFRFARLLVVLQTDHIGTFLVLVVDVVIYKGKQDCK